MKFSLAIVAFVCVGLAGSLEASLVDECKRDLMLALADIHLPDDIQSLVVDIRQSQPEKSLSLAADADLAAKFKAPSQCIDYVQVIDDLMNFDSCAKVNMDDQLTTQFWTSIPKDSALDTFLGSMKVCVRLLNA